MVEKSEKCKPNFVGFVLKHPTTLVTFASAVSEYVLASKT
jgi:hypothetical protein